MSLRCTNNVGTLRKMPLNNCKVELKLRWMKHCVLFVLGVAYADNDGADYNYIIFTIKDYKLYVPTLSESAKDNQKL